MAGAMPTRRDSGGLLFWPEMPVAQAMRENMIVLTLDATPARSGAAVRKV
jgi:hypothetical protein